MGQEGTAEDQPSQQPSQQSSHTSAQRSNDALLIYAGQRLWVRGRALRLVLWIVFHQQRINDFAPETGQMWLSWKGTGAGSVDGDLKVPLGPLRS